MVRHLHPEQPLRWVKYCCAEPGEQGHEELVTKREGSWAMRAYFKWGDQMCVPYIIHLVERFFFTYLRSDCVSKHTCICIFSALKNVGWDRFLWCFVFKYFPYSLVTLKKLSTE